jgi:hypothetical protein
LTVEDVNYMASKLPGGSGVSFAPDAPHHWYLADDHSKGYMDIWPQTEASVPHYPIQEALLAHGATNLGTDQSAGVELLRAEFERLKATPTSDFTDFG